MNTRDPLNRLLSGWNQKFSKEYPFYKSYMKKFQPKTTPFEQQKNNDPKHGISFGAFIAFLMSPDKVRNHEKFNAHWKSVFTTCQPCSVDYKFVTKQESTYEDAALMFKLAKIENITYVSGDPTKVQANKIIDMLADVPKRILKRIYIAYWMDFAAFNYSIDKYF